MMKLNNVKFSVVSFDGTEGNRNNYTVRFKYDGRQMTTKYFMGFGIKHEPKMFDVLECLFLDHDAYYNSNDLEDFANEFGYDMEFPKNVEKVYKACHKNGKALQNLFGDDFEKIREQLQDYNDMDDKLTRMEAIIGN